MEIMSPTRPDAANVRSSIPSSNAYNKDVNSVTDWSATIELAWEQVSLSNGTRSSDSVCIEQWI